MKITRSNDKTAYGISAYDQGWVAVAGNAYTQSLVLAPDRLESAWPPQHAGELRIEHFRPLLAWTPEVVLIGTGARLQFPAEDIRRLFLSQGIGVEVMDTAAACRTYNILMSEGRRVVAAILMIE